MFQETTQLGTVLNTDENSVVRKRRERKTGTGRQGDLPTVSPFWLGGFNWYVPRFMRRHFSAVHVAQQTSPNLPSDGAVICYANHPGWWDPLIAFLLNQLYFPDRIAFAPIDQTALTRYSIFRKLGFYGVDMNSLAGARRFLSVTRELLAYPTTAIWLTPGGDFADARARVVFRPGLGHLASTVPDVTLLPVAVEYTFWREREPEALVEFGQPIRTQAGGRSKAEWQRELEQRLAATQARLAEHAISRNTAHFEVALDRSTVLGGWYSYFRRGRALLSRMKCHRRASEPLRRGSNND